MQEHTVSSISKADTLEKIGEFWDTHDFTDFDDPNLLDIESDVSCAFRTLFQRDDRIMGA
jgi:hypothetical protein